MTMSPRIQRLFDRFNATRNGPFPVCVEKGRLLTQVWRETEGEPAVLRNAKAIARLLDEMPVFLEADEPIAGNLASRPNGIELTCLFGLWQQDDLDALAADGFVVDEADLPVIAEMNAYWEKRALTARTTQLYDDERLWPFAQLGVVLPAFTSKREGWGSGQLGGGYGVRHEISQIIGVFQIEKVLGRGLRSLIDEAEAELARTRIFSADDVGKAELLRAIVITLEALVRFAHRFAALAEASAATEADPVRRAELLQIAAACRRVPEHPARGFREAMQALWFAALVILPSNVLSFGRIDQLLHPYYQADLDAGAITQGEALEYLQWLRIKDSQALTITGKSHRNKLAGFSKWHNCAIGGQRADGSDATNAMTWLVLEAARTCPAPHHTITLRVHEGTPQPLLAKALEVVASGIGLPAFVGDKSCIDYLCSEGVPIETARDYALAGCLGVNLPGRSRIVAGPMFVAPLPFHFALNHGVDPRTGRQAGPATGRLEDFADFDQLFGAVKAQLAHFQALAAQFNNVTIHAYGELFPQPFESALTEGGIGAAKNVLGRTMPFENASVLNCIGMINVADSLAAIRRLVFEDGVVTLPELKRHLDNDWAGPEGEALRQRALGAPKFGNDDDDADALAAELYACWAEGATSLTTTYGGTHKPNAISIGTSPWPGGLATPATPDGRFAGEALAEEAVTPMRGRAVRGALASLRSAAKIDQSRYLAMALDMKFSPAALATPEGVRDMARMVRDYFAAGGKHIQFNVVDGDLLARARAAPDEHGEVMVRLGGCSAYFAHLPRPVQEEIMLRTEFASVS
ncbi:MAG: pyruvate formate lyase family protein [Sphingomonas sp.]